MADPVSALGGKQADLRAGPDNPEESVTHLLLSLDVYARIVRATLLPPVEDLAHDDRDCNSDNDGGLRREG